MAVTKATRVRACAWVLSGVLAMTAAPVLAQEANPHAGHQMGGEAAPATTPEPEHDHAHMHGEAHVMLGPGELPMNRLGSGTSWMPDTNVDRGLMGHVGPWMLMTSGQAFLQVLHEGGHFGETQAGSINWAMGMAQRRVGTGWLLLSAMGSAESWTIRGCGYPNMLATGELCAGEPIHEKQHPHDMVMELAASYTRPLRPGLFLQAYGGPAGEPALGPAAFPHRASAYANLMAPISHHWLDATHITFGVATVGVFTKQWKAEASVFNGREPDEDRRNLDLAKMNSYSGRVWWMPTPRWSVQVSAGHLVEAEPAHEDLPVADKNLVTTSVSHTRRLAAHDSFWASTVAWGRASDSLGTKSQWLLAETSVARNAFDTWFGRAEIGTKPPHDLSVHGLTGPQGLGKLQGGYVRHAAARRGWEPGVGFTVSAAITNATLASRYGSRVTYGAGVFATVRPKSTH